MTRRMPADILAEEQLKLELLRVLSRHFLRQLENLLRSKTGAFFPVDHLSNLELGKRLGNRKELQMGSRGGTIAKVRLEIAYRLVNELGISLAETGRQLGVSTSAISKALTRAKHSNAT